MKRFLVILMLIPTIAFSAENKLSLMGSLLFNNTDTDGLDSAVDEESTFNFGVGVRALIDINSELFFRTGGQVIQKSSKYDINVSGFDGSFTATMTYLSVPLTIYKSFNEKFGVFGGVALQAKLADSAKSTGDFQKGEVDKKKNLVYPLVVGMDINLNEQIGLEFSYEYPLSESYKDVKVSSLIGSFLYHF